jgi:hypothetical protein
MKFQTLPKPVSVAATTAATGNQKNILASALQRILIMEKQEPGIKQIIVFM